MSNKPKDLKLIKNVKKLEATEETEERKETEATEENDKSLAHFIVAIFLGICITFPFYLIISGILYGIFGENEYTHNICSGICILIFFYACPYAGNHL